MNQSSIVIVFIPFLFLDTLHVHYPLFVSTESMNW